MKKTKRTNSFILIVTLTFLSLVLILDGQAEIGINQFSNHNDENHSCLTPASPDILHGINLQDVHRGGGSSYTIKVFVHAINENDGTGGPVESDIYNELADLDGFFAASNICFTLMGIDQINDSYYASHDSFIGSTADSLVAQYPPLSGVVDIYILPSYTFFRGTAYAIPNHYMTMYVGRFNTCHMAHEMGHCLGLYHTFETWNGTSIELVNGSNCSSAGDKVCDTQADDNGGWNDTPCMYNGGGTDPQWRFI